MEIKDILFRVQLEEGQGRAVATTLNQLALYLEDLKLMNLPASMIYLKMEFDIMKVLIAESKAVQQPQAQAAPQQNRRAAESDLPDELEEELKKLPPRRSPPPQRTKQRPVPEEPEEDEIDDDFDLEK